MYKKLNLKHLHLRWSEVRISRKLTVNKCSSLCLRYPLLYLYICPVSSGCKIHRLQLCRRVRPYPPIGVLDRTLNDLMVRFQ